MNDNKLSDEARVILFICTLILTAFCVIAYGLYVAAG